MANSDDLGWNIGRYTVYGEIASGGMATVHIGRMVGEVGFAKLVAVKRLHSHLAKDPEFLDMFLDEVRLASRIRHPNVVQPLDVVVTNAEVFLVMEYIHGESLSRLLRAARQQTLHIPLRIASSIITSSLHGLHAAHEAKDERGEALGIVHRDVSPQNIMVGVDGVSRVLDFGIAKATDQVHSTKVGELKGKLAYMAPEQVKGKPATRRTDVYATGIVLWECLTGHRLFDIDGASVGALMNAQANVPRPSKINPQVTPELDELVLKALNVNPDLRFQTAAEMADALADVIAPAGQSQVGQFVETTAKAALTERSKRIAEIEREGAESSAKATAASLLSSRNPGVSELSAKHLVEDSSVVRTDGFADTNTPPTRLTPQPPPIASSRPSIPGSSRPSIPGSGRSTPPPTPRLPTPAPRLTPTPPPATQSSKKLVVPSVLPNLPPKPEAPIADFGPEHEDTRQATPASPFAPTQYHVPPPTSSAPISLAPPQVPTDYAKPARTTTFKLPGRKRSLLPYIWIVVGIALVVLIIAAPELVRKRAIERAQRDGLDMTVEAVDISLFAMHATLKNVTIKCKDIPGANLHAEAAEADLSSFEVSSIVVRNADLVLDGRFGETQDAFDKWTEAHGSPETLAGVQKLKFANTHVSWNGVLGPGTKVEGSGIVIDLGRVGTRALGMDGSLTFPALTFSTPLGNLGPWRFDGTRESGATKVKVLLDAGAPGGPSIDVTVAADGPVTIDSKFQRAHLLTLGVPLVLLGQKADDAPKADLSLHVEVQGQMLVGNVRIQLYDARVGGSPPGESALEAHWKGPRAAPVPFDDAKLTLGTTMVPLGGSIAYDPTGLRVEAIAKPKNCGDGSSFLAILDTRDPSKSGGGLTTKSPCKLK